MTQCSPVYPECSRHTGPNPDCECSPVPPPIGGEQGTPGGRPSEPPHAMSVPGNTYPTAWFDLLHRPRWHSSAACRDSDVNMVDARTAHARARAFDICGHCTVRDTCLDWAINDVQDFNPNVTLGGTDGAARRRLAQHKEADRAEA